MEAIINKKNGKRVGRLQYIAEAIARANRKFPSAWVEHKAEAKAAIMANKTFETKLNLAAQGGY